MEEIVPEFLHTISVSKFVRKSENYTKETKVSLPGKRLDEFNFSASSL